MNISVDSMLIVIKNEYPLRPEERRYLLKLLDKEKDFQRGLEIANAETAKGIALANLTQRQAAQTMDLKAVIKKNSKKMIDPGLKFEIEVVKNILGKLMERTDNE